MAVDVLQRIMEQFWVAQKVFQGIFINWKHLNNHRLHIQLEDTSQASGAEKSSTVSLPNCEPCEPNRGTRIIGII